MKLEQIRTIAKSLSIKPGSLSKADLIRKIQLREGNFDCYSTAIDRECSETGCIWREDCLAGK